MGLHDLPLLARQRARFPKDVVGDPNLADVVEQESVAENTVVGELGLNALCECDGVVVRARQVRSRVRISSLDDERQRLHRCEIRLFELVQRVFELFCSRALLVVDPVQVARECE